MSFDFKKHQDKANSVTDIKRNLKVETELKAAKEAFNLAVTKFKETHNCFKVKTEDKIKIESALKEGLAKFLLAKGSQSICYEIKERAVSEITKLKEFLERFPEARNSLKKEMAKTKLSIIICTEQLKKDFSALEKEYSKSGVKFNSLPLDAFLMSMQSIDLLQLEDRQEKYIVGQFTEVVSAQRSFFWALANKKKEAAKTSGNSWWAGFSNAVLDASMAEMGWDNTDLLDQAIKDYFDLLDTLSEQSQKHLKKFLEDAVKKSGLMNNLVEAIINKKAVEKLEVEKKKFDALRLNHLHFICKSELEILLKRYETSGGNYRDYAEQISGIEIPKFLPIIDKLYTKGKLGFEDYAKKIGKHAKLEKKLLKVKKEFSREFKYTKKIPAPITTGAIVTRARFILNAKLEAAANMDFSFESHNFLDVKEKRYLSVEFNGICELKKKNTLVSAGLELTFFELFQSTGTATLSTQCSAKIDASAEIKKSDRTATFTAFECNPTAKALMELTGKLTLNFTVTPYVAKFFKSLGLPKPEKTFQSKEVIFIRAIRTASINYKFPFAYQKLEVPISTYELKTGEWDISYPAADQLMKQIKDFLGITDMSFSERLKKARDAINSEPLTDKEKEELKKKYAPELIQS